MSRRGNCRLGDYGFVGSPSADGTLLERLGTAQYKAPEVCFYAVDHTAS